MPIEASANRLVWLWKATLAVWVLLFLTGAYLMFFYRPTAAATYSDMENLRNTFTVGLVVRRTHGLLSWMAVVLALALPIMHVVSGGARRVVLSGALLVVTVSAAITGYLLPWDQLALWAFTAGTSVIGYGPVFGDNVRFVLLGGVEISAATLRFWLVVHVAVLPILSALLVGLLRRHQRDS